MKTKNKKWNILSLKILLWLVVITMTTIPCSAITKPGLKNQSIKFTFDAVTGTLVSFKDLKASLEFLDRRSPAATSLWEFELETQGAIRKINISLAGTFRFSKPDAHTLILEWGQFKDDYLSTLVVKVTIRLQDEQALSRWNISISGIAGKQLGKIIFPNIPGLQDMGDEELAVPVWLGELYKNPRSSEGSPRQYTWSYPGPLSLQALSLYNPRTHGFYAACNDTASYAKTFSFLPDSLNNLRYRMENYPVTINGNNIYTLPYDAIIGAFKGDWLSAAEIYRKWAIKQKWCRDSRFRKHAHKSLAAGTAIWVWNRGRSENVLAPALDLKKRANLPVNVLWHWWHNCPYDDGFPEYFPPREGDKSFKAAVDNAHKQGVNTLLYMNAFQWGTATQSFEKEQAQKWAIKDKAGNTAAHVYNIFTKHSLTPMCIGTAFWKNKYAALAAKAINDYHAGGIYMDQACLNYQCYDPLHKHTVGGGNYWLRHFGILTDSIRANDLTKDKTILAGEGCAESWLPYLDAFLTLQVSKERYAGIAGPASIPFFQAVYHDYAITFGSYSSLVTPPYDELWPRTFAPDNQEQPLAEEFDEQFLMEQARSFAWGQQPTIANYHETLAINKKREIDYLINLAQTRYKALKYLLYGRFMRPPPIVIPEKNIAISRLSIYAGQQQDRVTRLEQCVPLLYTNAWKATDGSLGIAIASISEQVQSIQFSIRTRDYGLPATGKVYIIDRTGRMLLSAYENGIIKVDYRLPEKSVCVIEISSTHIEE